MTTSYPDLLKLVADVLAACADAPALCGIDMRIDRVGGTEVLLQLHTADAADVLAWAGYLGSGLRLRSWTVGDRVVTECAAVREIGGVVFRAWTHLDAVQADAMRRLCGPAGADGYAWLPVDDATAPGITRELATVTR